MYDIPETFQPHSRLLSTLLKAIENFHKFYYVVCILFYKACILLCKVHGNSIFIIHRRNIECITLSRHKKHRNSTEYFTFFIKIHCKIFGVLKFIAHKQNAQLSFAI